MNAYIIWDISPEIFEGFALLRWYGVSWVLGILIGHQIMLKIYKSEEIPAIELDKLTVYIMLGAIIGARFGHILFYDPIHYLNNPIEILPIKIHPNFQFTGLAGLASHGGILGALLSLYLYNRNFKRGYLWMLDRLMIAGTVLGGLIRLGNLMNSEIIGIPSSLPWAFVFTRVDQIPRHPAQLYEAIFYLALCIVLYAIWKNRGFYNLQGFIFGLGITLIFTQRFLIEFLKENQMSFEENLILNMGQILSIPLIFVGIALMILSRKKLADK
ncbi:prolipoprotein diacylglyceryl transferase [Fulvivirga sp. 29W222]|uniref:Phosphatidylglycerol--prolipoprotein diacylglyceryl transferase n=1 Tax=Fulvivirga marina TaxID=2494733 RepID=A0A937G727_9BACT|nr:prolipoprotein diacylglyceryl transferase [Fulvivirga marina]MBL6449621.1 prolipoprotein diacylglyceryl transferase [Fulvivirga marina]